MDFRSGDFTTRFWAVRDFVGVDAKRGVVSILTQPWAVRYA